MTKLLGALLLLIVVYPAFSQYEVQVSIDGLEDTEAYLGYHLGEKKYIEDTAVMNNGEAVFSGEENLPHGIYFLYTPNYFLEFVISKEQKFKVSSVFNDPLGSKQVEGSKENEIFLSFQMKLAEVQGASNEARNNLAKAANKEDSTEIFNQMKKLEEDNRAFQKELVSEYPESFVSSFINLIRKPEPTVVPEGLSNIEAKQYQFKYYRDHYFDGIDFSDNGILRTPLFEGRLDEYVDRLTSQNPDSLIKSISYLVQKAESNPEVFRYVVVHITNKFATPKLMGHDAVFVHMAEKYYLSGRADWADESTISSFQTAVDELKPNLIGTVAPSFQVLDTTLAPMGLQDIQAKYTVLFFYDPGCGHCQKQTPKALDIYHKLRNEGVEMAGINVATDLDQWKDFVAEKQLDWINGADPFVQSNFRKDYNIKSIPTIYVLDQDKKIIGKRLGVEQLEEFINARIRIDGDS